MLKKVTTAQKDINADFTAKARRVVIVQLTVTSIAAAGFFVLSVINDTQTGAWDSLSAGYGGLLSVVLALISIGGFKRANSIALSDPGTSMIILYIGAVIRFAAVIVLLGIGLGYLKLDAIAVFSGFALAQASYLMSVGDRKAASGSDGKH